MTYRRRVSSGFSEARIRGLEMSALPSSSALYVSFVQRKVSDFLTTCIEGPHIPPAGT
jgi:hypothetical protein